ncbi:ferredoxin, partial [Kitasatospora sp. NPDC093558]|uniref:ferredoxin n=1 Tax=Kitasatospora sp. NPDC093558 TaxID=3155201 RepID=UPI003420325F
MTGGREVGGPAADGREAGGRGAGGPARGVVAVVVHVDRDRCIGSGMCALSAPGSLALGAEGLAEPVAGYGVGGAELTDELSEAVDFCPVEALTLYSARGGYRIAGPCLSPSVAGRPLRPATRRRLGRPLPHQQAD